MNPVARIFPLLYGQIIARDNELKGTARKHVLLSWNKGGLNIPGRISLRRRGYGSFGDV